MTDSVLQRSKAEVVMKRPSEDTTTTPSYMHDFALRPRVHATGMRRTLTRSPTAIPPATKDLYRVGDCYITDGFHESSTACILSSGSPVLGQRRISA